MSVYATLRTTWTSCLPAQARHRLWRSMPPWLRKWRMDLIESLQQRATHDEVYDDQYYEHLVDPVMAESSEVMARSIVDELQPASVIDVGCGTGLLLRALKERGVRGTGLERADAGLKRCEQRGVQAEKFDILADEPGDWRAEVVISTEVAEHLPPAAADRFVDLLCAMGHQIVLTAAEPGEPQAVHLNEQPTDYWIEKLQSRGFRYDHARSERWRTAWKAAGVAGCFANTVMIFERQAA
jgi:cyclopropane fatty-acyl-phospholipid synthase-like methyltransferase